MRTLPTHPTALLLIFSWLIQFYPQSLMYLLWTICMYYVHRLNIWKYVLLWCMKSPACLWLFSSVVPPSLLSFSLPNHWSLSQAILNTFFFQTLGNPMWVLRCVVCKPPWGTSGFCHEEENPENTDWERNRTQTPSIIKVIIYSDEESYVQGRDQGTWKWKNMG